MNQNKKRVVKVRHEKELIVCSRCGTSNEHWRKRCRECGKYIGG